MIFLAAMVLPVLVFGQTPIEATTSDGKKVLLSQDGTWTFKKIEVDSTISFTCNDLIKKTTDDMTGKVLISSEASIFSKDSKNGISSYILKSTSNEKTLIWGLTAIGSGCIDENAKINLLFTDGSRLEIRGNNKFNCKGDAVVYFSGIGTRKSEYAELKTKLIQKIRVWAHSGYVEEEVPIGEAEKMRKIFACIENFN